MKTLADLCPAAYGPPDEGQNFTPPPRHPRGRGPGSNLSPGEVDGITVFGRLRQEDCQQHGAAVRLSQNQKNNKSLGFWMSKGLEAHDRVFSGLSTQKLPPDTSTTRTGLCSEIITSEPLQQQEERMARVDMGAGNSGWNEAGPYIV